MAYIKVGIIILIVGGVVAYVYKKNRLNSDLSDSDVNALMESGINELRGIGERININDRETKLALNRAAERNRQLSITLDRAESRVSKLEARSEKIETISKRAAERNIEITELGDRARELLHELRDRL